MISSSSLTREDLLVCVELGKALTSELDPDRFLGFVLERISAIIPAKNWSMLLLDEQTNTLHFSVTVGIPLDSVKDLQLEAGMGVAGQAMARKETVIVPDVRECPHFDPRADLLSGFKTESLICVPLVYGGEVVGVGEVVNPEDCSDRTIALLEIIAEYAAIAVVNTRRYVQIREMALREHVTGLYNTRHLYRHLQKHPCELAPIALIFLDMDNFKQVVDTYGHLHGTRALQEVARILDNCIAPPGYAVSYGGDEFVVVLPDMTRNDAQKKTEEIRGAIAETVFLEEKGLSVHLTASFGLASCPEDAQDPISLLSIADNAMFGAKRKKKNHIE